MSGEFVSGLKCRLCGKVYPKEALNFCTEDFGPLEVAYNYEAVAKSFTRQAIESRPRTMWRYRELLPVDGEPTVGRHVGGTPLIRADRLAKALGLRELYVKNDAVNHPSLSFKDRVVAVALSKAVELGFETVGCASTGNLAGSVAANAAAAGLNAYVLIPDNLEQGKVLGATIYGAKVIAIQGNYDHVNRLCSQIAFRFGWGFVNVNLRPFYAEGSKSMGFEIAEDMGWRIPDQVVVPMAGGSLIGKLHKSFKELERLGLVSGPVNTKMYGAQATGCNPIANTVKTDALRVKPVRNPDTIAKSLAIGDPADGYFASQLIRDTGGWSEDVDDDAIVDSMRLLAETEGIWAETAGGVTVAVARKLIAQGKIDRDASTVLCITGNGLKTQEALIDKIARPVVIKPSLAEFEALVGAESPELVATEA
ncbi:threonine synthase [Singulisphaera acidiphila]|uniref:Threonine synthase n=1 Tax=Singulisphaera acidiphila (strain ATCC BAA-1392 / DSM 18658 / VKM B-2454 / MOB10) TaxID=886293 RepID=L0DMY1_SINAD|nr:threonine synthase [Singulisphaera acidiphila]AGA30739.1 threonine synthase [Singulisphaera acidiphila DSM 18658]